MNSKKVIGIIAVLAVAALVFVGAGAAAYETNGQAPQLAKAMTNYQEEPLAAVAVGHQDNLVQMKSSNENPILRMISNANNYFASLFNIGQKQQIAENLDFTRVYTLGNDMLKYEEIQAVYAPENCLFLEGNKTGLVDDCENTIGNFRQAKRYSENIEAPVALQKNMIYSLDRTRDTVEKLSTTGSSASEVQRNSALASTIASVLSTKSSDKVKVSKKTQMDAASKFEGYANQITEAQPAGYAKLGTELKVSISNAEL